MGRDETSGIKAASHNRRVTVLQACVSAERHSPAAAPGRIINAVANSFGFGCSWFATYRVLSGGISDVGTKFEKFKRESTLLIRRHRVFR